MKTRFISAILMLVASSLLAQSATNANTGKLHVPDAAQFVGKPEGTPLSGDALLRRTHDVGALLRCPVCQGMSVADSPAEMAVNMKEQVRDLLARGYTEEQILAYFELSYGEFVLLEPKFDGMNATVWLLPVIGLLIGGAVVFRKLRGLEHGPPVATTHASADVSAADPYVTRVRDLVNGDER